MRLEISMECEAWCLFCSHGGTTEGTLVGQITVWRLGTKGEGKVSHWAGWGLALDLKESLRSTWFELQLHCSFQLPNGVQLGRSQ